MGRIAVAAKIEALSPVGAATSGEDALDLAASKSGERGIAALAGSVPGRFTPRNAIPEGEFCACIPARILP